MSFCGPRKQLSNDGSCPFSHGPLLISLFLAFLFAFPLGGGRGNSLSLRISLPLVCCGVEGLDVAALVEVRQKQNCCHLQGGVVGDCY